MERDEQHFERNVEAALERLAQGWDPMSQEPDGTSPDDEALVVAHLEALALLGYATDPEAPSPAVKERLMAQVAAEPRAAAPPSRAPSPVSSPRAPIQAEPTSPAPRTVDPVDMTLRHSSVQAQVAQRGVAHEDPGDMTLVGLGSAERAVRTDDTPLRGMTGAIPTLRAANDNRRVLYALAAGLVFCLVALGYLYGQLQAKDQRLSAQQIAWQEDVQQARSEMGELRDRIDMVTNVARQAYPMQRVANTGAVRTLGRPDPSERAPDGIVYVCGHHQQWYLSLTGLEAPVDGKAYHVWFVTQDGRMLDGGAVEVAQDGTAEVQQPSMPDGTRGFVVSLEDGPDPVAEPSNAIILRGEQPVKL